MEINELKKMLKKSTAVLILENGDPSIVVVDYKTYKELLGETGLPAQAGDEEVRETRFPTPPAPVGPVHQSSDAELLERINKDILALKEQIEEEEKGLDL